MKRNFEKYFLSAPDMGGEELNNITQAFEDNWIAPLGPFVNKIEEICARESDRKEAVAMNSGTAAIHIALRMLGVKEGDHVLCSDLTFIGSVNPILMEKATPVFIDSEDKSWNMDPKSLEKALKELKQSSIKPKAAIVVDLFGHSPDWDSITNICREYDVPIIEDSAEAVGASYKGRKCGSFGKYGIFSFNGNKIITSSGGGALLLDEESEAKQARKLITQAREPALHYEHFEMGFNYRMSNICAAIGVGQFDVLNDRVSKHKEIFNYYKESLSNRIDLQFLEEQEYEKSNFWLTCTLFPEEINVFDLCKKLNEQGIEARPVWKPMHLQPLLKEYEFYSANSSPVVDKLFHHGLCLPSWSKYDREDIEFICQEILDLLK